MYQTFEQRNGGLTLERAHKIAKHYRGEGARIYKLYGGVRPLAGSWLKNWLDTIPLAHHDRIRRAFWVGWKEADQAKLAEPFFICNRCHGQHCTSDCTAEK